MSDRRISAAMSPTDASFSFFKNFTIERRRRFAIAFKTLSNSFSFIPLLYSYTTIRANGRIGDVDMWGKKRGIKRACEDVCGRECEGERERIVRRGNGEMKKLDRRQSLERRQKATPANWKEKNVEIESRRGFLSCTVQTLSLPCAALSQELLSRGFFCMRLLFGEWLRRPRRLSAPPISRRSWRR